MAFHRIGFWYSEQEPHLPMPAITTEPYLDGFISKCKEWVDMRLKFKGISIDSRMITYMGYSYCRICHCENGDTTYKYGGYVFPNGLFHYIINHHIDIPVDFQQMIINNEVINDIVANMIPIESSDGKRSFKISGDWLKCYDGIGRMEYAN